MAVEPFSQAQADQFQADNAAHQSKVQRDVASAQAASAATQEQQVNESYRESHGWRPL